MPTTTAAIAVDPRGHSMDVDVQDSGATSVTCYTEESGESTHTLPVTITERTVFYLVDGGTYLVSALVGGREIAGVDGAKATVIVEPHGPTIEVAPVIDAGETLDVAADATPPA